jgi:hypothetical protein
MSKYLSTFSKTNPVIKSDQAKHGYYQILMWHCGTVPRNKFQYKPTRYAYIFQRFALDISDPFSGHGTTTSLAQGLDIEKMHITTVHQNVGIFRKFFILCIHEFFRQICFGSSSPRI